MHLLRFDPTTGRRPTAKLPDELRDVRAADCRPSRGRRQFHVLVQLLLVLVDFAVVGGRRCRRRRFRDGLLLLLDGRTPLALQDALVVLERFELLLQNGRIVERQLDVAVDVVAACVGLRWAYNQMD